MTVQCRSLAAAGLARGGAARLRRSWGDVALLFQTTFAHPLLAISVDLPLSSAALPSSSFLLTFASFLQVASYLFLSCWILYCSWSLLISFCLSNSCCYSISYLLCFSRSSLSLIYLTLSSSLCLSCSYFSSCICLSSWSLSRVGLICTGFSLIFCAASLMSASKSLQIPRYFCIIWSISLFWLTLDSTDCCSRIWMSLEIEMPGRDS